MVGFLKNMDHDRDLPYDGEVLPSSQIWKKMFRWFPSFPNMINIEGEIQIMRSQTNNGYLQPITWHCFSMFFHRAQKWAPDVHVPKPEVGVVHFLRGEQKPSKDKEDGR